MDVRRSTERPTAEAVVLAIFGGVIGIIAGTAASKVISDSLGWQTLISTTAIGAAFSFAAIIGIAADWYPASTASRLDPIEALRYE
jgi:putative ABC transport system permease protein